MINEVEELSRDDLIAILETLGGYDKSTIKSADHDTVAAILKNRIALVADVARIESALLKPLPLEWRAALMTRRIELENAARAVRDAAAGKQPPRGNLEINIPPNIGLTHYYGAGGRTVCARVAPHGGRVVDLFAGEFRNLLVDRQHGLSWQTCNPEALQLLGSA